jgi:hypothetical protein
MGLELTYNPFMLSVDVHTSLIVLLVYQHLISLSKAVKP